MALCLWERVSNSSCFLSLPKSPVSFAVLPKLAWQSQHPQLRAQTAELLLFWSCHSKSKLWPGHSPCLLRGICETTRASSVSGMCVLFALSVAAGPRPGFRRLLWTFLGIKSRGVRAAVSVKPKTGYIVGNTGILYWF